MLEGHLLHTASQTHSHTLFFLSFPLLLATYPCFHPTCLHSKLQTSNQDVPTFTQPLLLVLSKILIVFHKKRLPLHSNKQAEVKSSQE